MNFGQWLDAERGRQSRVAERFCVSLSAVSQWRTNGVPRDRILDVHELTDREVSIEELLRPPSIDIQQDAAA